LAVAKQELTTSEIKKGMLTPGAAEATDDAIQTTKRAEQLSKAALRDGLNDWQRH